MENKREWLINWVKGYKANEVKISEDNISFVLPKQGSEEDFDKDWHIIHYLKNNGYNVEVSKGDWEYTTATKVEPRSIVTYSGHKAYLRNRYIVKVSV